MVVKVVTWEHRIRKFWSSRKFLNIILLPLSLIYNLAHLVNYHLLNSPKKVAPFVICVGNVIIGGAGKTLFAIELAKKLLNLKIKVAFISRGYGSKANNSRLAFRVDLNIHTPHKVGDEALLLAQIAPTYICANRLNAAMMASNAGAEIIIMDDGLQNNQVHKDYNFLIIDSIYGLGNRLILPAGPLRESLKSVYHKADSVVLIENGDLTLHSEITKDLVATVNSNKNPIENSNYFAFSSIANPAKFHTSLKKHGFNIVGFQNFSDHYIYNHQDIIGLFSLAGDNKLITTAKDYVKIPKYYVDRIEVFPVELDFDIPEKLLQKLAAVKKIK